MTSKPARLGPPSGALALALAFAGCQSPATHLAKADDAAYSILASKRAELAGDAQRFSIEPASDSLRKRLEAGEVAAAEGLSLLDCLHIADATNRQWQDRRESLFLDALDLALERWRFGWIPDGSAAAELDGDGHGADTATGSLGLGFSKILGSGATLLADLGLTLTRNLSSGDVWHATSDLGFQLTQPLLRGFGSQVTLEPLTQAERDVVYSARSYERFRRTLAVQVAERYYRILQQVDELDNERTNYENLMRLRERNEGLAAAGRLSDIQVNQALQDELRAESRVIQAGQRLAGLLDDFKLFLGLPVDCALSVDRAELASLAERGVEDLDIAETAAVRVGLAERLDLANVRDAIADARRGIDIAADDLRMGVDVIAAADAASDDRKPLKYGANGVDWSLALDVDFALDRMPQRNAFRAALIALQAAERTHEELEDQITADLRDLLRSLVALRKELEIQTNSVGLAERRVESTRLNFDAGRAETRDLLEAQEALVTAKNAATRARIDFELARLALYRDLEALRVEDGRFDVDPELAEHLLRALEQPPERSVDPAARAPQADPVDQAGHAGQAHPS
jgi:outer membrane protein TolC